MLSLWTEIRILEEDDNAPSVISISYIGCNNFADQDMVDQVVEICNRVRI